VPVERRESPKMGALVAGQTGVAMRVGIFADQQKFQTRFFQILNAIPHHDHS
jgi:hypothetical protein